VLGGLGAGRNDLLDALCPAWHAARQADPVDGWNDVVGDPSLGDAVPAGLPNHGHRMAANVP